MDAVVNGNIHVHVAKQMNVCKMEELVAVKSFLQAHRDMVDLEEQGENVIMSLKSSTDQNQRSPAGSPSSITNNASSRRNACRRAPS